MVSAESIPTSAYFRRCVIAVKGLLSLFCRIRQNSPKRTDMFGLSGAGAVHDLHSFFPFFGSIVTVALPRSELLLQARAASWQALTGATLGFRSLFATMRSASSIVIPAGMVLNRKSDRSSHSIQVPTRIPLSAPGRRTELTMSIRLRLALRRSRAALAAARDWQERRGKSPGFIGHPSPGLVQFGLRAH